MSMPTTEQPAVAGIRGAEPLAPQATTAMAHRLARLVYRMLKYGQLYVGKGAAILRAKKPPTTNRVCPKESLPTAPTASTGLCLKLPIKTFLETRATNIYFLLNTNLCGLWGLCAFLYRAFGG
jgi:hypothetical protein